MAFLDTLTATETLRRAWKNVASKRGTPGIDRVTIDAFSSHLDHELDNLVQEIRSGAYQLLPALRIRPRFLDTSDRALVIPTVRDRVVLRAMADTLAPVIEPTFSSACHAFRKGFSAIRASETVGQWVEAGKPWVFRGDIKNFFDSIPQDQVLAKLKPFVDPEGLAFLARILRSPILDHHQVTEMVVGLAQGSALSPLLGNLYLNALDHALLNEFPETLRYCDDIIILGEDEHDAVKARDRLAELLEPLKLRLNESKTRICRAEDGFTFLGYHFDSTGRGPAVKAVQALHCRLEDLETAIPIDLMALDSLYRGWKNYFGHHPRCWTQSSFGILALLRHCPDMAHDLVEPRWSQPFASSTDLARNLCQAWGKAGLEEQAWCEMALAFGGSAADQPELSSWSPLLGTDHQDLKVLARRLVGSPRDRLPILADGLAELGHFSIAGRLSALYPQILKAIEQPTEPQPKPNLYELATPDDIKLLLDWFQGREGAHAEEAAKKPGHRWFVPKHRPLDAEDWRAHLRGEKVLALPLVRTGNTVLIGVLDIDISRKALHDRPVAKELMGRALGTALRLRKELESRGCDSLLELSGSKGYHLWIRLTEPIAAYHLRRWLLEVVRVAGPLPEGIRVEEFPNRDRVKADSVGPLVKLPLGIHSKTGQRCALLDAQGTPLPDPLETIRNQRTIAPEAIFQAPRPQSPKGSSSNRDLQSSSAAPSPLGPRAQHIVDGCKILFDLVSKAKDTAYLNHRERYSLLCVLGHLGDEGKAALHYIIGHTYNYHKDVTDRHIRRLPECPISCPKLRELHPQTSNEAPCQCRFELRGRGYPTPLLHGLRATEVAGFRVWRMSKKNPPTPSVRQQSSRVDSPESKTEGERLARKIVELKRHRRGIERAITKSEQELLQIFELVGTETLSLDLGVLRRIAEPDGKIRFVIEV